MSETKARPATVPFHEKAASLLEEYGRKLSDFLREARRIRREIDANSGLFSSGPESLRQDLESLRGLFVKLKPSCEKLARQVSARIEHAKLAELTRVELTLRLFEFEHVLSALGEMFPVGPGPKVSEAAKS